MQHLSRHGRMWRDLSSAGVVGATILPGSAGVHHLTEHGRAASSTTCRWSTGRRRR